MSRTPHRAERGQALVELVLGLLIFITVLVFGIHFAEVSHLSMRVQQAAHHALFNASGQLAHENVTRPLGYTVPGLTDFQTQNQFRDFDAVKNGATSVQQVLTEIQGLEMTCNSEPSVRFMPGVPVVPQVFFDSGGIRCGAEASVGIFNFPRTFFDGNWGFRNRHYAGQQESYTVCATPRSANGVCGQFGLLVGDWSLQGRNESRSHDVLGGGNPTFANAVESAFNAGGGGCGAAIALSNAVTGTSAGDACSFAFSYKGMEHGYIQTLGAALGPSTWNTGGTRDLRGATIETYLGVPAARRF